MTQLQPTAVDSYYLLPRSTVTTCRQHGCGALRAALYAATRVAFALCRTSGWFRAAPILFLQHHACFLGLDGRGYALRLRG